jgi:hypothetical protein
MTWQWKSNFKDIRFTFLATGVEYGHTSAAEDLNPRHVVENSLTIGASAGASP